MSTFRIILDVRKALKDNSYPLKAVINIRNKGRIMFSIGIYLRKSEWNGDYVVKTPRKHILNNFIRQRHEAIEAELIRLDAKGELRRMSLQEIKACLMASYNAEVDTEVVSDNTLLKIAFASYAESAVAERTKSIHLQTLAKISSMYEIDNLRFSDINNRWLREWESRLRSDSMATNSISVHLRNLRAVFNRAIDDDVISQDLYPFRKFKIKTERTAKRSLSIDELRTLMYYPCEEHLCKYRDYFLLIFYLMGINMVDLAAIKGMRGDRIEYRRAKTGRLYSIKVEREAMELINRYKGKDQLVDIVDRSSDYRNFLARMNEGLKNIGEFEYVANNAQDPRFTKKNKKQINRLFPDLSTYWARHTWATIAASLEIPKETIAAALGHGQNSVTDIYIDFDQRKVDEANRRVIDYVCNAISLRV